VCADFPVRHECLAFALRTRERHGIWGGMTECELYQLWKKDERGTDAGAAACHPLHLRGDRWAASGGLAG
jgi:hypothetical protein